MNELDEARQAKSDLQRAEMARQVTSNSVYIEAITMMKADCFNAFEKSGQDHATEHSKVWLQMNAINEFQANLEYIMENGAYAKQTLTNLQRIKNTIGL